MNQDSTRKARVNVRRAEVMEQVEKEIQQHYQSELISHIRSAGNVYNLGHTEFFLAREFGFCNGVRRAIDNYHMIDDGDRIVPGPADFPDRGHHPQSGGKPAAGGNGHSEASLEAA